MTPDEARGIFTRNEALIRKAERARLRALDAQAQAEAQLVDLKARRQELTVDLRAALTQVEMAKRSRLTVGTIQRMSKQEMTKRGMGWAAIKASR